MPTGNTNLLASHAIDTPKWLYCKYPQASYAKRLLVATLQIALVVLIKTPPVVILQTPTASHIIDTPEMPPCDHTTPTSWSYYKLLR